MAGTWPNSFHSINVLHRGHTCHENLHIFYDYCYYKFCLFHNNFQVLVFPKVKLRMLENNNYYYYSIDSATGKMIISRSLSRRICWMNCCLWHTCVGCAHAGSGMSLLNNVLGLLKCLSADTDVNINMFILCLYNIQYYCLSLMPRACRAREWKIARNSWKSSWIHSNVLISCIKKHLLYASPRNIQDWWMWFTEKHLEIAWCFGTTICWRYQYY